MVLWFSLYLTLVFRYLGIESEYFAQTNLQLTLYHIWASNLTQFSRISLLNT